MCLTCECNAPVVFVSCERTPLRGTAFTAEAQPPPCLPLSVVLASLKPQAYPVYITTQFFIRIRVGRCLFVQGYKGVVFCPWNDTADIGRAVLPGTVVYTVPLPYETRYPHNLNVTYNITAGNDGTFGILSQNFQVRTAVQTLFCVCRKHSPIAYCQLNCLLQHCFHIVLSFYYSWQCKLNITLMCEA